MILRVKIRLICYNSGTGSGVGLCNGTSVGRAGDRARAAPGSSELLIKRGERAVRSNYAYYLPPPSGGNKVNVVSDAGALAIP